MAEEQPIVAPEYRLRLFVAGNEPNSGKARLVVARLCERHLQGRYEVQIVDVLVDYQAAIENQVQAVPTLFVETRHGKTVIVGSLSDEEKVVVAFQSLNGIARP